tara:strand:- start:1030 stop:1404 length:375 start_codon:yes stop_codon:yes gene_type:complete
MSTSWQQTIDGEPTNKSNSRRIVMLKGKKPMPRLIKSVKAMAYVDNFMSQVKPPDAAIEGDVRLRVKIWYGSRRQDLDVSLIMDLLEKSAVILNDRQVKEIHAYHALDKENPRSTIRIESLTED